MKTEMPHWKTHVGISELEWLRRWDEVETAAASAGKQAAPLTEAERSVMRVAIDVAARSRPQAKTDGRDGEAVDAASDIARVLTRDPGQMADEEDRLNREMTVSSFHLEQRGYLAAAALHDGRTMLLRVIIGETEPDAESGREILAFALGTLLSSMPALGWRMLGEVAFMGPAGPDLGLFCKTLDNPGLAPPPEEGRQRIRKHLTAIRKAEGIVGAWDSLTRLTRNPGDLQGFLRAVDTNAATADRRLECKRRIATATGMAQAYDTFFEDALRVVRKHPEIARGHLQKAWQLALAGATAPMEIPGIAKIPLGILERFRKLPREYFDASLIEMGIADIRKQLADDAGS